MDKLKMHSPDLTQDNIAKIRAAFPDCVTEARDENDKLRLAVDFDQLRQVLSDSIVDGPQERYRLDWPGKREALLTANAPIAKTLRPCREESVGFDTTQNLFVEGDNLEALKLLQETYLGKVKMIYIDPPYNTGNDFVYNDNFTADKEEHAEASGQRDEQGNRLLGEGRLEQNNISNGRFHSDWLSMMSARLKLARNLLADDGIIFISIDTHECGNLIKVCDEILGAENHKSTISVRRGIKNVQAQFEDISALSQGHEYILMYSKDPTTRLAKLIWGSGVSKPGKWDTFWRGTDRHTMRYELLGVLPESGQWRWEEGRTKTAIENYKEYLEHHAPEKSLDDWYVENLTGANKKLNFVRKNEQGTVQYYVPPSSGKLLSDNWMDITLSGNETKEFDTEKNTEILKRAVGWICQSNMQSLVLDFFAGSATTAHAVMQLNAEDGGNRKFIMAQLPEETDEKSEAFKAGYKNIAEISKERIRRSGTKILEGDCHEDWNKDVGFRVLKIDSSNMKDVFYTPDETKQEDLLDAVDNIKPDRSGEDLLFQVLLDWGVDLTLPIRRETVQGKEVFFVDDNALIACFDMGVTEALVRDLATHSPLRAVFRDTGFDSDSTKINVEQIFRQASPETDVKAI